MNFETMTINDAEQLGVESYRAGNTFREYNVRPSGFVDGAIGAGRPELIEALDRGWHVANLAEPVVMDDGTVIGSSVAAESLELICNGGMP